MSPLDSIHQQCLTTQKSCGFFDHSHHGILKISGADRIKFLHNILTNDIQFLKAGRGVRACFLNAQAQIIAVFDTLAFQDRVLLLTEAPQLSGVQNQLEKLIIAEQVDVENVSDRFHLFSVHGPKSEEYLKSIFNQTEPLPKNHPEHINAHFENSDVVLIRMNLIGDKGYGILAPRDSEIDLKLRLTNLILESKFMEIEEPAFEIMRITGGIPKHGIDYDETNLPLESHLDETVSYTKGCYPGQEIIARLDARGGVSKKLSGLVLKGELIPKKGDLILDEGIEVGKVTSAAFTPVLKKTVVLGYLKKDYWMIGHSLVINSEGVEIPVRVEPLPFYTPNSE